MPTVIATIQNRKGSKEDFDPARMKPGEIAVTTDGTNEAYVCVGNGQCKEFLKQVKKVNGVSPNDSGELTINKNNVELGNVDNTSDEDKPISEAQQMALDGKVSKTGDVMTGSLTLQRSNGNTAFRLKNSADASEHLDIYINGAGVPLVTHVKNGVSSNTMALYGDRTWFGQPVSITSGGTEATTTAEARKNLGAAPAGLVTQIYSVSNDTELDNVCTQFFTSSSFENETVQHCVILATTTNTSIGGGHFACEIYKMNELYGCIKLSTYIGYGKSFCRVFFNGSLYPWEWINPPMNVGVEYRITERYNGKPVYAKLVEIGAMPNNSTKTITFSTEAAYVIDLKLALSDGSIISAGVGYDHMFSTTKSILLGNTKNTIRVMTQDDMSSLTANAVVKYCK